MTIKMTDREFAVTLKVHGILFFNMKNSPAEVTEDGEIDVTEFRLTEQQIEAILLEELGVSSKVEVEDFIVEFEEMIPDEYTLNSDKVGYYYS